MVAGTDIAEGIYSYIRYGTFITLQQRELEQSGTST
jgi:hypothetical protein